MTLLSTLLPGLRDFRVPFTVGSLWLVSFAIIALTNPKLLDNEGFAQISTGYKSLPNTIQIGLIGGAAYGLGVLLHRLARDVSHHLGRNINNRLNLALQAEFASLKPDTAEPNQKETVRQKVERWSLQRTARARDLLFPQPAGIQSIYDRILDRTFHAGYTEKHLPSVLETGIIAQESSLAAMKFSENKPEQFNEYDRLVAESELKHSLAAPVAGLAIALSIGAGGGPWSICALILGLPAAAYLTTRGYREQNEANLHLLTAMSLGWTNSPTLDSIRAALDRIDETSHEDVAGRTSTKFTLVIVTMLQTLSPERKSKYYSKLRHPSRAGSWGEFIQPADYAEINEALQAATGPLDSDAQEAAATIRLGASDE